MQYIKKRWHAESGYKEVLAIAIPLIISTGSWSIQHLVDSIFLTWYSPDAIAAVVPSGILNFTILSVFIGTASYVSTFVAQYFGAGKYNKIGTVVWQGIFIALIAAVVHISLYPFAEKIFSLIGHSPSVQKQEVIYFRIMNLGAFFIVASAAMSGFFSGRGKTWTIMWINICATIVNIILNYILIFGKLGLHPLGMKGAAIASILSQVFSCIIFFYLLTRPQHEKQYAFLKGKRIDKELFSRLIRFGLPSGTQLFLEIFGITFFVLLIGRLGTENLAATNIALRINMLGFMPMIGVGITASIIVGQYIGKKNIPRAEYGVYSCLHLALVYMVIIATLYVTIPGLLLKPFTLHIINSDIAKITTITQTLLLFIAVFTVFDTFNIIFANAIKGAGDTRFAMYLISILTVCVLIIPGFLVIEVFKYHIYFGWGIFSFYVCTLALAFFLRYRSGKWKGMSVIR